MGHMFEFLACQDVTGDRYFDVTTMQFHGAYNRFDLKYGQWTDDASMGLCIADSLILQRGYDGSDIRRRFWNWWYRGYNNAFRLDSDRWSKDSVGLGGNIAKSIVDMNQLDAWEAPSPVYVASGEDAGNGSLMRLAPLPLFFHAIPSLDLHYFARMSSLTTHPGPVAAEACAFLAHVLSHALKRPANEVVDAKTFLEAATADYLDISGLEAKVKANDGDHYQNLLWLVTGQPVRDTERCWAWRNATPGLNDSLNARGTSYNNFPVSADYFGSFSLDALAIAMWAIYNSDSFDGALAKAINTFGDADSHGSICGQIAGALYGRQAIHPQFIAWLNQWDEHEFAVRAILLHELGTSLADLDAGALLFT